MNDKEIRVLIADDHDIVRAGIKMLLDSQPDIEVVGEANDGNEAVELVIARQPHVVIMDISMPGMSGIDATKVIKQRFDNVEVIGLTMHADDRYFFELLKAGASGYVVKGAAPDDLLEAVRAASRGEAYIHPTLARKLISDYAVRAEAQSDNGLAGTLTEREREVLRLIADGATSKEIADRLVISANTVDRHRSNIMAKLDLHNKAELIRYAISRGIVSSD